jgi:sensor histidine kinase regulating citrate/malate metabolism
LIEYSTKDDKNAFGKEHLPKAKEILFRLLHNKEDEKDEQNNKIMRTTLSGNEDYCGTVGKAERTDENDIEKVNHPKHYNSHPSGIECIEIVRHYNFDVGNAIKFSPAKGTIMMFLKQEKDSVMFILEDEGPGIEDDVKTRIFDKFYQADGSHKAEGNGLGLALVKRIVDSAGGTIKAENREYGGCRFVVELPIQKDEAI